MSAAAHPTPLCSAPHRHMPCNECIYPPSAALVCCLRAPRDDCASALCRLKVYLTHRNSPLWCMFMVPWLHASIFVGITIPELVAKNGNFDQETFQWTIPLGVPRIDSPFSLMSCMGCVRTELFAPRRAARRRVCAATFLHWRNMLAHNCLYLAASDSRRGHGKVCRRELRYC